MKKYTFTLTIEEVDTKPLSSSIIEDIKQEKIVKQKVNQINFSIKEKRIEILKTLLPIFKEQITEPLGLTCNIDRVSNWLHKDCINISGDKLHSANNIKIYIETPYIKDEYGNNVCQFRDVKIYFVQGIKDVGTYTYGYQNIEDFYTKMKDHLRKLHIMNK